MGGPGAVRPGGLHGLPGGAAVVAIKATKHPQEVAKLMDWLASEPIMKEFSERTLFIPGNKLVAEKGLAFKTDNANAKRALDIFVKASTQFAPLASKMPAYKWSDRDLCRDHHPHGRSGRRPDHARPGL